MIQKQTYTLYTWISMHVYYNFRSVINLMTSGAAPNTVISILTEQSHIENKSIKLS